MGKDGSDGNLTIAILANHTERGDAMAWLVTLFILLALVHFELWPLVGLWLCYMVATSLTTPNS